MTLNLSYRLHMEEEQTDNTPEQPVIPEAVGLARFHKITISGGIIFLGLMVRRYWLQYQITESPKHVAFGIIAALMAVGLALYLRSFSKKTL